MTPGTPVLIGLLAELLRNFMAADLRMLMQSARIVRNWHETLDGHLELRDYNDVKIGSIELGSNPLIQGTALLGYTYVESRVLVHAEAFTSRKSTSFGPAQRSVEAALLSRGWRIPWYTPEEEEALRHEILPGARLPPREEQLVRDAAKASELFDEDELEEFAAAADAAAREMGNVEAWRPIRPPGTHEEMKIGIDPSSTEDVEVFGKIKYRPGPDPTPGGCPLVEGGQELGFDFSQLVAPDPGPVHFQPGQYSSCWLCGQPANTLYPLYPLPYTEHMVCDRCATFLPQRGDSVPKVTIPEAVFMRLVRDREAREQLQVQLAACGVAALGGTRPEMRCEKGSYGWSPAYWDTLNLRLNFEALCNVWEVATLLFEALVQTQWGQGAMCPCCLGGSAVGHLDGCSIYSAMDRYSILSNGWAGTPLLDLVKAQTQRQVPNAPVSPGEMDCASVGNCTQGCDGACAEDYQQHPTPGVEK